ncbi:glutathione S-transferase family protein [Pendulispora albinea]|uniref:Glutathione S-transferase family protein n=1 Tax=Pendulispora albinea TaxID=2741071 RepID=A0ABZ2LU82_9BACT
MYDLYIANKNYSSWSLRPWLVLRELGIPFNEHMVPFDEEPRWVELRKISPSGKVPCLDDNGTKIWESSAIVEYLAERHPNVWPSDPAARDWARCAAAEMHAGFGNLRSRCTMNCGVRARLHEVPPELTKDITRLAGLWNDGLSRFGGPFLAGKAFTAVDAFFGPVAYRIQTYGLTLDDTAAAYAARLLALPSMQSWYADALRETARPPSQESALEKMATVFEDLRAKAG